MLEEITKRREELQQKLSVFPEFCQFLGLYELEQELQQKPQTKAPAYRPMKGDTDSVGDKVRRIFEICVREARDAGKSELKSYYIANRVRQAYPDIADGRAKDDKVAVSTNCNGAYLKRLRVSKEPRKHSYIVHK